MKLNDATLARLRTAIKDHGGQQAIADAVTRELLAIDAAAREAGLEVEKRKPVGQSTISMWLHRRFIPGEYAIPLERALEGDVERYDIRADLYPREKTRGGTRRASM